MCNVHTREITCEPIVHSVVFAFCTFSLFPLETIKAACLGMVLSRNTVSLEHMGKNRGGVHRSIAEIHHRAPAGRGEAGVLFPRDPQCPLQGPPSRVQSLIFQTAPGCVNSHCIILCV